MFECVKVQMFECLNFLLTVSLYLGQAMKHDGLSPVS